MAGAYTQANRPLRIKTPLGTDVLLLERFSGEESVSAPFRFQLDLLAEKSDIDPAQLLGKSVTVEIDFAGETRHINGVVSRFSQGGRGARLIRYRAEMVPQLWTASLARNSRIFQELSVPDILKDVLSAKGVAHSNQIAGTFHPRNYCAQYRETDLGFISRLMEEEGIYYFFKHADGAHDMQLTNLSMQAPVIPGASPSIDIASGRENPQLVLEPRISGVELETVVTSGKVTLWDHHFQSPNSPLDAEYAVQNGESAAEIYDYPGEYAQRFDGVGPGGADRASEVEKIFEDNQRTAGIRAREVGSDYRVVRATSNYPQLVSGHKFTLKRHYRSDVNGEYFLTSVRHVAAVENYENSEGAPFRYENAFTCIPAAVPYAPPRRTPKARVDGAQTAVVVGPAGSEIFTDKFGRVKVQFFWDREGKKDDSSSCWLRVATPWAGKNWGMIHIPRVGSEVVVDFLEGDPDRPIIVGMVYNPNTMPPYTLPDNMTQSGIKTRSTQKGEPANFNELRFEDKKGEEEIYLHAEKNLNTVVENDETHTVGFEKKDKGDQTLKVFNNQVIKVGEGKGDAADGSQTLDVYKDQTVTLATGNQTITLKEGNRTVTLDKGSETVAIKMGDRTVTLDQGNDALTLKTGNLTTTLKTGNSTLELDVGNASTKAKLGKINEEAMQGIEMKVGQNSIKMDQTGITIKGMMVKIEGQIQTEVKGLMTKVSADAMVTVKGGVTMIN